MSVEGGLLSGAIEDAQGRLNLNAILTEPQPLGRLFDRLGLSPELLAALGDAADTDSETRFPGGAEDQYYLAAEPPRRAANGALVVKEDLLSIRGFDAFVLKRLQDSVVVLPAGSGQANINTASDEVLMAVIPGLAPAQAAALRRDVEQTPVRVVSDVIERLRKVGWSGEGAPPLGVSSRYFFVRGEVRWGEASARMRVAVERMGAGTAPRILWKKMEVLE